MVTPWICSTFRCISVQKGDGGVVPHAHCIVHAGVGESSLAPGADEVFPGVEPSVDFTEVGLEIEFVNRVAVWVGEMVPLDDFLRRADVFGNETGDDLLAYFGGIVPFRIVEIAGHLDDEYGVICRGDFQAGVFGFADAVEDLVPIVGVESFKAFGLFDEEPVGGDGFEMELFGGAFDRIGGILMKPDEGGQGDGRDGLLEGKGLVIHVDFLFTELGNRGSVDDFTTQFFDFPGKNAG